MTLPAIDVSRAPFCGSEDGDSGKQEENRRRPREAVAHHHSMIKIYLLDYKILLQRCWEMINSVPVGVTNAGIKKRSVRRLFGSTTFFFLDGWNETALMVESEQSLYIWRGRVTPTLCLTHKAGIYIYI